MTSASGGTPASSATPGLATEATQKQERALSRAAVWAPLLLAVACFAALSTAYNLLVPLYEAPDEQWHARYINSLLEDGRLPDASETYQAWQPPLYYGAAALMLGALQLPPLPELPPNPDYPPAANAYLHGDEGFPYSGEVLSVRVLRGAGTLFGAGTIVFIYLSALTIFPARRLLAAGAALTAAAIPQFAFIAATVSNDAASYFFGAGVVFFGLRYLKETRDVWLLAAGAFLAVGMLVKATVGLAAVVPIAAVLFAGRGWTQMAVRLALLAAGPLLLAGWFYAGNLIQHGDIFVRSPRTEYNPYPLTHELYRTIFFDWLRESFWYRGGYMNIRMSPIIYDLLDVVSALALAGVIVVLVRGLLNSFQRTALWLLASLPVLALVLLLYHSATNDFQAQGRYLFPAMPAIALFLPLGLSALFSRTHLRDHAAGLALPCLLLAVNIYILAAVLPRAY